MAEEILRHESAPLELSTSRRDQLGVKIKDRFTVSKNTLKRVGILNKEDDPESEQEASEYVTENCRSNKKYKYKKISLYHIIRM